MNNLGSSIVRRWLKAGSASIFAATIAAVSCAVMGIEQLPAAEAAAAQEAMLIDPPAPPGSTSAALAVEGPTTVIKEHQVLMTWLEPGQSGRRLRFSRFSGAAWSQPITVAEPVSAFDPTDRPSLTVIDAQAVRRTLIARTGNVVARSGDGGRTWTRLSAPTLPFAAFAGGDEGGYVFWLAASGDESAKLFGSRVLAGETLIDPSVAPRSDLAAAMTWDGPIVAYRERGPDGAQHIAIVRRRDARWTRANRINVKEQGTNEKPNSGPRAAALRRQVAVAWYTESEDRPRVVVAFSSDAGRTFGDPLEMASKETDSAPSGSVDVALDNAGRALVLWTVASGREVALHLARVSAQGGRGKELVLAKAPADGMGDIAQIAGVGDSVAVSWVDAGRIRALTIPLAAIPAAGGDRSSPSSSSDGKTAQPGRGRVGEFVPSLELTSLDSQKVSLTSFQGRAVLLNLWATWCLPCIKEMPELAALHERYGQEGLAVIGSSVDDTDASDKVRQFVSERNMPFEVWRDPGMLLYRALRVRSLPVTFIIDRDGRIVFRRDSAISADDPEVERALRQVLKD